MTDPEQAPGNDYVAIQIAEPPICGLKDPSTSAHMKSEATQRRQTSRTYPGRQSGDARTQGVLVLLDDSQMSKRSRVTKPIFR